MCVCVCVCVSVCIRITGDYQDRVDQQMKEDIYNLTEAGVDYIFAPSAAEMYPHGYATDVELAGIDDLSEGTFPPFTCFYCLYYDSFL